MAREQVMNLCAECLLHTGCDDPEKGRSPCSALVIVCHGLAMAYSNEPGGSWATFRCVGGGSRDGCGREIKTKLDRQAVPSVVALLEEMSVPRGSE